MWVYRINDGGGYQNIEFARTFAMVSKIMELRRTGDMFPADNVHTLTLVWLKAQELWRHIGWDGSISGEPYVSTTPGPAGFAFGFLLIDTSQRAFLASPYPCEHIRETLDWDAYTDSEEAGRAQSAVIQGVLTERKKPVTPKWRRSNKGNLFTEVDNSVITVFPTNNNDGFKAVVSFGSLRQFTPVMKTEFEACAYVINQYDRLKRELVPAPLNRDDPWADD